MTQHEKIRNYIETHGSITPMEAFEKLHITKLSTRICEMDRNREIYKREMIRNVNDHGEDVCYMKYSLLEAQ